MILDQFGWFNGWFSRVISCLICLIVHHVLILFSIRIDRCSSIGMPWYPSDQATRAHCQEDAEGMETRTKAESDEMSLPLDSIGHQGKNGSILRFAQVESRCVG